MQGSEKKIDYSIVICTFNPDERILQRCLNAVHNLYLENISIEVILVDNNSMIPISSLNCVREYADKNKEMIYLHVKEQGVRYARMAAIDKLNGKYTVYFDYDNEPDQNYLQEIRKLHLNYPSVAAWGPGRVNVDFIDGIEKEIEQYARVAFQERDDKTILYSSQPQWQSHYPFGTGLVTFSFLLKKYNHLAKAGHFTMMGRQGQNLSSGEDTQMILLCIKEGFDVGVSSTLGLKHMISSERANFRYLKRLAFGTSSSYHTSLLQVFPDQKVTLNKGLMSKSKFSRRALKQFLGIQRNANKTKIFDLINFIGLNSGAYMALGKPLPFLIEKMIKYLRLK